MTNNQFNTIFKTEVEKLKTFGDWCYISGMLEGALRVGGISFEQYWSYKVQVEEKAKTQGLMSIKNQRQPQTFTLAFGY